MHAISIIVPMYGVEKYLRRCLDSILNQTFTDWQAICVNDGSPDNSGKIAEEYATRDKRFLVIHKPNGGPSDARNVGIKHATGEYIMFMDGDDFIHPQTMEMTYYMARRDDTDIVSYTYDRVYRPMLMLRHFLGMNTDNVKPFGMRRRYGPECVCSLVTNDIFRYATEKSNNMFHANKRWLIKHCQTWKNLYRRSLIADIQFIKEMVYVEDFPWWSAVMLKNPRVTILNLPLYYYWPNFGGLVLSTKQFRMFTNLCMGIEVAFTLYHDHANQYQFQMWNKNFLWFFVRAAFNKIKHIGNTTDIDTARQRFIKLYKMGVFDFPPTKWARKLRKDILDFIGM